MNGKRLPALLGLALLPAIAFGAAQTAEAATHDPGSSSVADTASGTDIRTNIGANIGTASESSSSSVSGMPQDRMRTHDPVDEESTESEESEQQAGNIPEETSREESMREESLTGTPMQEQSMRDESETPIAEPRHRWSEQSEEQGE
ncbi:hypothetical protein GCM10023194_76120 [Planotetraspora phitsanulokensis]|uniref:Secreted protein n=1 Tax=Planotetraspora phitsanulokensis TaxID=575192 RepID=A0A8J3TZG0_9ACTN|nr:hypothetical protein [Planotetraspora phitsanulokensis]GII35426.1 hypothetical protein Pph01_04290 [Planotetraspora phitsanulokensis]